MGNKGSIPFHSTKINNMNKFLIILALETLHEQVRNTLFGQVKVIIKKE